MQKDNGSLTAADNLFLLLFFAPFAVGIAGLVLGTSVNWAGTFVFLGSLSQIFISSIFSLRCGRFSFSEKPEIALIPAIFGTILLILSVALDSHSVVNMRSLALISIAATFIPSLSLGFLGKRWKRGITAFALSLLLFPQGLAVCRWVNMKTDHGAAERVEVPALWTAGTTAAVMLRQSYPYPLFIEVPKTPRDAEAIELEFRSGGLGVSWVTNAKPTGKLAALRPHEFQALRYEAWQHTGKRIEAIQFDLLFLFYFGLVFPILGPFVFLGRLTSRGGQEIQ